MAAARRALPLLEGLIIGCFLMTFKQSFNFEQLSSIAIESCPVKKDKEFADVSERWIVHPDDMPPAPPKQDAAPKVVRVRFAATELGIRERLMVAVLAESSLALALNSSIGRHVPRIQLFADAGRIDAELAQMNNLSPYLTGDSRNGQKSQTYVLALMQNLTEHESYDWLFLVKDSTYVNPFALKNYMDKVNWNQPVLIGEPDDEGRCRLESGVLISNPAMQLLLRNRQQCLFSASESSDSDQLAFEKCLLFATNLTCTNFYQGVPHNFWRVDGPHAAHDSVGKWAKLSGFNSSIVVSKILSDADSSALHDHFVRVEMARLDAEIAAMESEIADLMSDTDEGPRWPAAVPQYSKPPNRYQVVLVLSAIGGALFLARRYFKGPQFTERVSLKEKVAVVTGANCGIGLETVRHLNLNKAKVYMLCRNEKKAADARIQLVKMGCDSTRLIFEQCDMANFASVQQCAKNILKGEARIDILINNAGIMFYPKYEKTVDGHETTWQTNHLGPFLLTELLLPALKKADSARIVNVSSKMHHHSKAIDVTKIDDKKEFGKIQTYAKSKLANVMHARELTRRLRKEGTHTVTVNSLHPGVVDTELSRHRFLTKAPFYQLGAPIRFLFLKTPRDGAQTSLYVDLSKKLDGISGKYFSDCKVASENTLALDVNACENLYNYSLEQVEKFI